MQPRQRAPSYFEENEVDAIQDLVTLVETKTTPPVSRQRCVGYWLVALKKATQGDDIGFVVEGKIVALRPVEVFSGDYALQEYGQSEHDMAAVGEKIDATVRSARARGGHEVYRE